MKSKEHREDDNDVIKINAYNIKVIKYPADITKAENGGDDDIIIDSTVKSDDGDNKN